MAAPDRTSSRRRGAYGSSRNTRRPSRARGNRVILRWIRGDVLYHQDSVLNTEEELAREPRLAAKLVENGRPARCTCSAASPSAHRADRGRRRIQPRCALMNSLRGCFRTCCAARHQMLETWDSDPTAAHDPGTDVSSSSARWSGRAEEEAGGHGVNQDGMPSSPAFRQTGSIRGSST